MKSLPLLIAGCALALGCSAGARSPELYRDDTMRILDAKRGDIKACYDRVLKTDPKAGGKVTVTFAFKDGTGELIDAKADIANTTAPEPVRQCVLSSLQGIRMNPADKRRGQATWTWDFSAPPPTT